MDSLAHLSEKDFDTQVLKSSIPVLVEFGAEWCRPCKALLPILTQLQTEWAGKANLYQLDVDKAPDIAVRYGVLGLPTLLLFKNGQVVEQLNGLQPRDKILVKILPHL